MLSLDGATKQEVNQSPLAFVETPIQANVEQALARKDAIIRVRNAQARARARQGKSNACCPEQVLRLLMPAMRRKIADETRLASARSTRSYQT